MRSADATVPESVARVRGAVLDALSAHATIGASIAVALSGGRDSVALLDALVDTAKARDHRLLAIHVHHGLSPNADAWAHFCTELCAAIGVRLIVRRVHVARKSRTGDESEARIRRYAALTEAAQESDTRCVILGHHRDDQAETLLIQLLRGAGPHGLAGMASARSDERGMTWLRPLLDLSRTTIDAYVTHRKLRWVDDESNASHAHLRNAVRHTVLPALARVHPASGKALARAAGHQAEAARLADDLAELDARGACYGTTLDRVILATLPLHRARNLLRWFLRRQSLPAPSAARLAAMLDQLRSPREDLKVRLLHAGVELGVHHGRIVIHRRAPIAFDVAWSGEAFVMLPHGRLLFRHAQGTGVALDLLSRAPVRVRSRGGGERFQLASDRPRRALKSILQEAGIPPWERAALPLVFCGDVLAAVAGLAIDADFRATSGAPGILLEWQPRSM